jgi:hypothetical protein
MALYVDKAFVYSWALVHPREERAVLNDNFFKTNYGPSRQADFALSLNSIDFTTLAINTDKYDVLYEDKFWFGPGTSSSYLNTSARDWKQQQKYIKINRQIRYENTLATTCEDPVILCYWADQFHTSAGSTGITNYSTDWRIIAYFRDV